ncbi:MAG: hypothetical protein KKC69_01225 [Acidobacteria bacterium]|nr:hypothetical protein [Acidobacteriota bacterium]
MNRNDENPVFERVVEEYNKNAPEGLEAKFEKKTWYREIHLNERGIKSEVHYEFCDNRDDRNVSADIHLQHPDVAYLADTLHTFDGKKLPETGGIMKISDAHRRKYGVLSVEFPYDEPAENIANAMHELIKITLGTIEEKYKEGTPETV